MWDYPWPYQTCSIHILSEGFWLRSLLLNKRAFCFFLPSSVKISFPSIGLEIVVTPRANHELHGAHTKLRSLCPDSRYLMQKETIPCLIYSAGHLDLGRNRETWTHKSPHEPSDPAAVGSRKGDARCMGGQDTCQWHTKKNLLTARYSSS